MDVEENTFIEQIVHTRTRRILSVIEPAQATEAAEENVSIVHIRARIPEIEAGLQSLKQALKDLEHGKTFPDDGLGTYPSETIVALAEKWSRELTSYKRILADRILCDDGGQLPEYL